MEGLRSSTSGLGGAEVTFSGESIQVSVHHPGSRHEGALEHYLFKRGGGLFATPTAYLAISLMYQPAERSSKDPRVSVNRRCECQNYSRPS